MTLRRLLLVLPALSWSAAPPIAAQSGRVVEIEVDAPSLAGNLLEDPAVRRALVYLPPGYDRSPAVRFPVLYLLHAWGVGPESWRGPQGYEGMDIAAVMDSLIGTGGSGMLVVMPDARNRYGGSWYASSSAIGDWERFVGVDLVEAVDSAFRASPRREHRALAGQSMGAYGALRVASANPGVFGTVVAVSGPSLVDPNPLGMAALEAAHAISSPERLFDGSPLPAVSWSKAAAFSPDPEAPPFFARLPVVEAGDSLRLAPAIWERWERNTIARLLEDGGRREALASMAVRLDVGRDDPLRPETTALSEVMRSLGVPHEVVNFPGGHVVGVRAHLVGSVLPYVSRRFTTTDPDPSPSLTEGDSYRTRRWWICGSRTHPSRLSAAGPRGGSRPTMSRPRCQRLSWTSRGPC